ncbi:hypothetical protein [Pseudonocardia endophytica]|uniref:Uncharacterized protein n=1 Tax=Pseudonocardia endophytica TaxID=401976 RepID=A0A4R1HWK9_PSEEN|nr:hypothetical protein [Pseudonocardia endophytica]TCK25445.1 hypothetical protein EV378_1253 [Pseudonocardia endophytica]
MTAAFDLPRRVDVGRHVRAALGPQPVRTVEELLPGQIHGAGLWTIEPDDTIVAARRDAYSSGSVREPLTAALVIAWGRDLNLGTDPLDVYAGRLTDDPDVAERVCARVAEMVRAEQSVGRTWPTARPAVMWARRLVRTRELVVEGDRLFWRPRPADPVLGGPGRPADQPDPAGGRAPAGLFGRLRGAGRLDGVEPVTAAAVEQVVRFGGYLSSHDERPDYGAVVDELRRLAGLPPSAPAASPDAGPGTTWLRRKPSTS